METLGRYNDEYSLMRGFTSGEKPAFTSVYNLYYYRIFEFNQQFLSNRDEALDVTADCFEKLWRKHSELGSLEHIKNFLYKSAQNACIDLLRSRKVKLDSHNDLLYRLTESGQRQVQLQEIRTELMNLVYSEVEKLPVKEKEVFLLAYKEGLKPEEIMERLQLSNLQMVYKRKMNAINLLKAALGNTPLLLALLLCLEQPQHWTA